MKKTILGLLFIAGISGFASGQLSFGIKGGLNYSKLALADVLDVVSGTTTYSLSQDESFQGFHVGIQTRIKLFSLFIQPELLFNTSGGNIMVEYTSGSQVIQDVKQVKFNKIDLPVLVGLKLGPARINAGPVGTVVLSSDSQLGDIIPDLESASQKITIGFQAGLGLDFLKKFTLDARYEGGMSELSDKIKVGGTTYPFDSRSSKFLLSLGFFF
jgi:hypothetical protein